MPERLVQVKEAACVQRPIRSLLLAAWLCLTRPPRSFQQGGRFAWCEGRCRKVGRHPSAMRRLSAILVLTALWQAAGSLDAHAQPAATQDFEGPEISWRVEQSDTRHRIDAHQRTRQQAHRGQGSEYLRVSASTGTYVYISHQIGRARVLAELAVSVWVKSDRGGLQVLARVVLPRTKDLTTGQPISTLIGGTTYRNVGQWQRLDLDDIPRLLSRRVRVLRAQVGPHVDAREAYIDAVVVNVYGGPGVTNVWLDNLGAEGFVGVPAASRERRPEPTADRRPSSPIAGDREEQPTVRGSVLLVDGRPMFARIVEHRGETLQTLHQLGFNAVKLAAPPSITQLRDARQLGLWLVCPPPEPNDWAVDGTLYDRVLAWDLGQGLSTGDTQATRQLAARVRMANPHAARPLVCGARSDLRSYSRHIDLLMLERLPLRSSFEFSAYMSWLDERPRLARPGTPIWVTVQTQPTAQLRRQLRVLAQGRPPASGIQGQQLRLMAYGAVASGARGVVFQSDSPLDAATAATRLRAAVLELVNLELSLAEPWAAAGRHIATIDSSDQQVRVAVLQTERAHLLMPMRVMPGAQYVVGPAADDEISFVVPGVPESNFAYRISPTGLQPLRRKRVTGGIRVTLENFQQTSLVVLAESVLVIESLQRRLTAMRAQAAELRREIAARSLPLVEAVHGRLSDQTPAGLQAEAWLGQARANLRRCESLLVARDFQGAYRFAGSAIEALAGVRRTHWDHAVEGFVSPVASPFLVGFDTLPQHWMLAAQLKEARLGANSLAGGEFEDLDHMLRSGWQHFEHSGPGLRTEVELSSRNEPSDRLALRIRALPIDAETAPSLVETPPVWVTSAPVSLRAGQIVRIAGWVRIDRAIAGSADGLVIFDSLGGYPLALRFERTDGWQPFAMYRVAERAGHMTLSFVLTGLGEAWLDNVSVAPFEFPGDGPVQGQRGQANRPRPVPAPR